MQTLCICECICLSLLLQMRPRIDIRKNECGNGAFDNPFDDHPRSLRPKSEAAAVDVRTKYTRRPFAWAAWPVPINEAITDLAKMVWHLPVSCALTPKRTEKRYFVLPQEGEFLFSHPPPNSLVVWAATEWFKQQHPKATPSDKGPQQPDPTGRKVSSTSLQFRISNDQALLAKYDVTNYNMFLEFKDKLPEEDRACFQASADEGILVARPSLQAAVDATDTASRGMATATVMKRDLWLQSLGFPREVQSTIQDLTFDTSNLFHEKKDESFHSLKHWRTTLHILGIYTPALRENTVDRGIGQDRLLNHLPPTSSGATMQETEDL
ncbi:hypothetical protein UY3_17184 [Chelonia mydas]|uniref:Uncharacterized protein n=1 Tax=Chelonia mydas TaxID=8469 RepID=M7B0Z4_CHEMY|nr:hypothetical protein UY3_17184 [Chelonia mydas]